MHWQEVAIECQHRAVPNLNNAYLSLYYKILEVSNQTYFGLRESVEVEVLFPDETIIRNGFLTALSILYYLSILQNEELHTMYTPLHNVFLYQNTVDV